jgi:hypothetical protein
MIFCVRLFVPARLPREQNICIAEFAEVAHAHRVEDSARKRPPLLVAQYSSALLPAALPAFESSQKSCSIRKNSTRHFLDALFEFPIEVIVFISALPTYQALV